MQNIIEITDETPPDGFERLVSCHDTASGLKAFIAIHSTRRGPAAGGLRMYPYQTRADAIRDVCNLARGMSYKNAMADLPLGGGKAVIIGDPARDKTPELFRAFGRFVEALGGMYYTAEDVGITVADIENVAQETSYAAGRHTGEYASGNPSSLTALGVYLCLELVAKRFLKRDSLAGLHVAIQGTGSVGTHLAQMLAKEDANLTLADIRADYVENLAKELSARVAPVDQVLTTPCDIVAPCAMGGALTASLVSRLSCRAIVGAANNQLAISDVAQALAARGVLFAPDYVVNGGGIINVAAEILKVRDPHWVEERIAQLPRTLSQIFDLADERQITPVEAANHIAEQTI